MMKVSCPAPLLHLHQGTGPISPKLSFPRKKMLLNTLFYAPLLFGRAL